MKRSGYTLNFVCFACRKAYKKPALRVTSGHYVPSTIQRGSARQAETLEAARGNCPQCGGAMVCAGRTVVVPPAAKGKEWADLEKELTRRTSKRTVP